MNMTPGCEDSAAAEGWTAGWVAARAATHCL
jgi:hypothetical protein